MAGSAPQGSLLKTGPVLVGIILNWWLWGILIMQYIMYLNSKQAKQDHRALKALVYFLFVLDAVQSILAMVDAFHWFVYNFGNTSALSDLSMAGIDGPVLDGFIALMVQLVYCWRIWVLSGRRALLPAIIALLGLISCIGGAIRGIQGMTVKVASKLGGSLSFAVILWNAAGAAADILIAVSMSYLLLKFSSRSTRRGLLRKVRLIIMFTLETNLLTTLLAVFNLIVVFTKPLGPKFTSLNLMTGYPLAKLYSNCFMVLLNQRVYNSGNVHSDGTTIDSTSMTIFRAKDHYHSRGDTTLQDSSSSKAIHTQPTGVRVDVTIDRAHEHSKGSYYGTDV